MKQIFLGGKEGSVIGNYALVDDEDYEYLNQWKWSATKHHGNHYAIRTDRQVKGVKVKVSMHRLLLKLIDPNIKGDHKDRNGLNNQKYNLRTCSVGENNRNRTSAKGSSSMYLGVFWRVRDKKWIAAIRSNKKTKHIGQFNSEKDAAIAYNNFAIKLHGQFANINIIDGSYI